VGELAGRRMRLAGGWQEESWLVGELAGGRAG